MDRGLMVWSCIFHTYGLAGLVRMCWCKNPRCVCKGVGPDAVPKR